MTRKIIPMFVLAAAGALISTSVRAQEQTAFFRVVSPTTTVITAFSPDGTMIWSNATVGVTGCVQKATTLMGPSNWMDFVGYTVTGKVMVLPTTLYMVVDLSAGPSASNYPVSYQAAVPAGGWTDEYKTTKMVFRRIPAGTFMMGSPTNELGRRTNETLHQVTLTKPFYIGIFEVTQKQWERAVGTWPSYFTNINYRDTRPVEQVSYNAIRGSSAGAGWPANSSVDADSFMGRLQARTGKAFDLPTEAQWEYAGRAGTITALNSGYNLTNTSCDASMAEVGRYTWNGGGQGLANDDTTKGSAKVGSYLPNPWGMYDIHGNVWEWCLDWHGIYPGAVTDPMGEVSGMYRVTRGGSWKYEAQSCRAGHHGGYIPIVGFFYLGFRVALPLGQ